MIKISVSILGFNRSDVTKKCLDWLYRQESSFESIEYILTDNGSSDDTFEVMEASRLPNKIFIKHPKNLGFGAGHNIALGYATGEFFVAMNNDFIIKDPFWSRRVVKAFDDPRVALVGIKGVPCTLKPNGDGFKGEAVDYLDGSFLCGRSQLLKKFGLFSPDMKFCFFEDSDISLRYKQMGYLLNRVAIDHSHARSTTVGTLDNAFKRKMVEHNRAVFLDRWGNCLKKKKFSNKVLIKIPSVGIGDVICSIPTIESIAKDHPTALIDVQTKHPDVFKHNPSVHRTTLVDVDEEEYDRVTLLDPNFGQDVLTHRLYARAGHTSPKSLVPRIVLSDVEVAEGRKILYPVSSRHDYVLICNPFGYRNGWAGRNWDDDGFIAVTDRILSDQPAIGLVLVGDKITSKASVDLNLVDKLTLRQLFSVMFNAHIFLGIDSMPFHAAQAFGMPSLVLFGATTPKSKIVDHSLVHPIINEHKSCVGCYQRKGKPSFNQCEWKDDNCVRSIRPDYIYNTFCKWYERICQNPV